MQKPDFAELLGPALASAIEQRGFTALTAVQHAVLDPALRGRDLRISSQTGSGKTVAIGFTLRDAMENAGDATTPRNGVASPLALVITPTRELAKQVDEELSWLYAPLSIKVASVTGGSGYRDERRAFAAGPAVIVGTPGRLLDHLRRGSIDAAAIRTVVLDEADRMLDLGFREELEGILGFAPTPHTTHLVSATFPHEVRALANKVQTDPVSVQGTPLGTANADIDHVIHLVDLADRTSAVINLLLSNPDAKTLIFARMRSEVTEIAKELRSAGFSVRPLSGEMEQPERNRALGDFKRGVLQALVATDVAARGIDVQDVTHVIHVEPPTDVDSYTHRSGRTGRAGRKGTSSVLTPPSGLTRTTALLRRAGVRSRIEAIASADEIRAQRQERLFVELSADDASGAEASAVNDAPLGADGARVSDASGAEASGADGVGDGAANAGAKDGVALDPRCVALAERLLQAGAGARALARLLARVGISGPCEPREIRRHMPPERPSRAGAARRSERDGAHRDGDRRREARPRVARERAGEGGWVTFRVTWGGLHGADARRLLAMMCRRGGIQGSDVGAIEVAKTHSFVDIAQDAAVTFEEATRAPDPRDPRVTIRREGERPSRAAPAKATAPHGGKPPAKPFAGEKHPKSFAGDTHARPRTADKPAKPFAGEKHTAKSVPHEKPAKHFSSPKRSRHQDGAPAPASSGPKSHPASKGWSDHAPKRRAAR
ncbi:DEAD/DEAH box helicase [Pendulispora albinea]|uniref:DEAD/DEAH box helicase n=1 Tax=Pendulispora albinea TaxID=2741071 RepID=A0ABZ2LRW6_9BACT